MKIYTRKEHKTVVIMSNSLGELKKEVLKHAKKPWIDSGYFDDFKRFFRSKEFGHISGTMFTDGFQRSLRHK